MVVSGQHHTPELRAELLRRLSQPNAVPTQIAREMGVGAGTAQRVARELRAKAHKPVTFPAFVTEGDQEEPIEALLERQEQSFRRKRAANDARKWYPVKVHETRPYGILWFGDPHLDNPGCDWPLLRKHIEIANRDGIYGGNIGDTTDNWPWTGRLARLWAESEVSDRQAKRIATWFMFDAGIRWLVWLIGNHDEWNGGTDFYKRLGADFVPVIDWRAQFVLKHDNGRDVRVDASHGRKGSSIYNPSHSTLRAAKFGEGADLLLTGHTHSFKLDHFEDAERGHVSWLAQVRGYKTLDHYATVNGFPEYQQGAAILSIIDPTTGAVQCFADVEEGADFLAWKRK